LQPQNADRVIRKGDFSAFNHEKWYNKSEKGRYGLALSEAACLRIAENAGSADSSA
jgi:hypothetical protein